MAKLKRDERVCPFCAETIKASAIRCRFCHSDVTPVVEPEVQPATEAKPKPAPAPSAKREPAVAEPDEGEDTVGEDTPAPARTPLYKNLTLVLAVLVALAAAGVGTLWWRAEQSSGSVAPNGTLVGDDARTEVLVSAADLAQRTLSYDYKSLANDMEVARARMTPAFRKQYDATMAQVRANTTKNKIVLEAVAVSSAIIKATEHKATVLVFLNQTTTAGTGKKANQQMSRNSLVINLTRGDGDWAISKLTSLG
jgi:Mce-associated membrane protein